MRTKILKEKIPGATVAIVCGMHGNEGITVSAAERVYSILKDKEYRGSICVHKANLAALDRGVRFIDKDLNRLWTDERIARIDALKDSPVHEERTV